MSRCAAAQLQPAAAPTSNERAKPEPPPEVQLEALLHLLRVLPADCPEARRTEARVAVLVRPHLVRVARTVGGTWKVPVEDLVQEGLLAVLHRQRRHPFQPGAAGVGRSAFPAWAMKLGRQAMQRAAVTWCSPVHLTDHARKAVRRAKRTAAAEGVDVSSVLRRQGLDAAATYALGEGAVATPLSLEEVLAGREERSADGNRGMDRRGGAWASTELLLSLVDNTAERLAVVAQRESVLWALYRLPRLQRLVLEATAGMGRPGGQAATERTVAQELRLSLRKVRELRAAGLEQLREHLNAQGLGPREPSVPRKGEVRRRRLASARGVQIRRPGQMPLLPLAEGA